ncbi:MAG TPA: riboflavin synthase [Polyangia bacterium]|jgi:riboflavin synthase|nr:riboflavin synthase [Polyangia bacterium]
MFTGIVEGTGIIETPASAEAHRLVVTTSLPVETLPIGASIAVDGVCLTVVEREPGRFAADLGPETLSLTTLGGLGAGDRVHLERPLNLGDPLGGHLVAGHVDGVGAIVDRRHVGDGSALELDVSAPPALAPTLVPKGSVAVDGVSLTVNSVAGNRFSVTLIPHTLAVTHLGQKPVGAPVNLEGDLIAKHVDRLVSMRLDGGAGAPATRDDGPGLSLETLRKHGFAT